MVSTANPYASLLALAQVVKDLAPERDGAEGMPLQAFEILVLIALHPGITMNTLAERTGLSQSSISRNVALLGRYHRLGKPGFDLVETHKDPSEPRRNAIFLNDRGRRALRRMAETIAPGAEVPEYPKPREWLDNVHRARRRR